MHLLSTRPGGFVEDESIVTRLDQTPADVVILSSADTTLALLAQACTALNAQLPGFPSIRLANLLHLRVLASLGVVALDHGDFDGLHLHAANGLAKQLGQAGMGAVAVGHGHCR